MNKARGRNVVMTTDELKDGGPAFPIETTATPYAPGMSLRDWFAGQALAGCAVDEAHPRMAAQLCYRIADAMLAARMEGDQ